MSNRLENRAMASITIGPFIATFLASFLGWIGQPRVETKAPESKWITLTNTDWATNTYRAALPIVSQKKICEAWIDGEVFPIIVQLRTYAKTNFGYEVIRPTNAANNWVNIERTTNLVIYHVLGYFDGTNAVELLEIEKPQTK